MGARDLEAASEASAVGAPSVRPRRGDAIREAISKYGLIALLVGFPLYFVITDLVNDGNVVRIGNNLVAGVSNGAIWALVALGYTMVYGIIELINFAHGDVFMIGSLVSFGLWGTLGLALSTGVGGLIPGLLLTMLLAMLAT